jgi:hypothetical protein
MSQGGLGLLLPLPPVTSWAPKLTREPSMLAYVHLIAPESRVESGRRRASRSRASLVSSGSSHRGMHLRDRVNLSLNRNKTAPQCPIARTKYHRVAAMSAVRRTSPKPLKLAPHLQWLLPRHNTMASTLLLLPLIDHDVYWPQEPLYYMLKAGSVLDGHGVIIRQPGEVVFG